MFAFETIFENIGAETVSTETQQIARGLRQRDLALLHALVEQYQYRLVRYLIYLLGRRDPVDDLVQETWLRVLERGRSYDGQSPFAPWLFTIARNLAIDSLRKRRIFSLDTSDSPDDDAGAPGVNYAESLALASNAPSPFEQAAHRGRPLARRVARDAAGGGARGVGPALSGRLVAGGDRRHRRRVRFHRIVADLSRPGRAASAHARSPSCKLIPPVIHPSAR
jgi:RNA polymerase sigma factor (sigma-70 family)